MASAARMASAPPGWTVIDTCNHGPERDGHIPELDSKSLTSSELLLRYIPDDFRSQLLTGRVG